VATRVVGEAVCARVGGSALACGDQRGDGGGGQLPLKIA
jgi:hypothetical protein